MNPTVRSKFRPTSTFWRLSGGAQAFAIVLLFIVLGTSSYFLFTSFAYSASPGLGYCQKQQTLLIEGQAQPCVRTVQKFLRWKEGFVRAGCPYAPGDSSYQHISVDGIYGAQMGLYVKCLQHAVDSTENGIIDTKLYSHMVSQCKAAESSAKASGLSCGTKTL